MTTSAEIIAELEKRVKQRRMEGKYPPGLEQQLEAEFKAITDLVHRGEDSLPLLEVMIDESKRRLILFEALVSPRSHFPGKAFLTRGFNRLTGRRSRALVNFSHEILLTNVKMLEFIHEQLRQQRDYDARQINQLSRAMHDRLMMIDVLAEAILELETKVSRGLSDT